MHANTALGRSRQRIDWLAILMTLVLALSMVPISRAHADSAATPGANYKPGAYTVPVQFKVDNRPNSCAELSNETGSLIVGDDGSLKLTMNVAANDNFKVGDLGTAGQGFSVISSETATSTMNGAEVAYVKSVTVSLSAIASDYTFTAGKMLNPMGKSLDKGYYFTVDFSNVPVKEGAQKIAQVPTAAKLTYNGAEQTAVAAGAGYTVEGGSATNAGDHTATLKLADGYEWSDGTTADKTIDYTIAQATLTATYAGEEISAGATPSYKVDVTGFVGNDTAANLTGFVAPKITAPAEVKAGGSYLLTPEGGTATANYKFAYVPGTLSVAANNANGMKPGTYTVTARMYVPAEVSPMNKNMFLTCDPNVANGLNATPPLTPASDNATLEVAEDGTLILTVPLNSNALSLYDKDGVAGKVSGATIASHKEAAKTYTNPNSKAASTKDGLYTSITLKLDKAQAAYTFTDWGVWMAPMGGDLSTMAKKTPYTVLNVDFSNVPGNTVAPSIPASGDDDSANGNNGNAGSSNNAGADNGSNAIATYDNGQLKAGTYTVTGNIFMEKADTGLPMGRAYLTSGEFPPNQPVTGNSTLVVDEQGRATVTVPLTIQVMNVKSLSGLNIVSSETDASGYLKSVTVDLGVIQNATGAVTRSCTANVSLTDMVVQMAGLDRDQSWPATLEVNLSGVPTAAGGTVAGGLAQTGDHTVANTVNGVAAVIAVAAGAALYARRRRALA